MKYSFTYSTCTQANNPADNPGWVETPSTRRIFNEIVGSSYKNFFITTVASMAEDGVRPADIETYYANCRRENIPGYPPQTPNQQYDQQSRSQRSGNSRQAGPARQSGANEGRIRDSNNGDYYARQHGVNCIYTERPGLQGSGSERSSRPWSDPRSSRDNQHPHDRSLDNDYGRSGHHHYGYSRNNNTPYQPCPTPYQADPTPYQAGPTPYQAGPTPSGNRFGGNFPGGEDYSSGSDWSGSTLVASDSSSQQGRASRGPERDRRGSRRAHR